MGDIVSFSDSGIMGRGWVRLFFLFGRVCGWGKLDFGVWGYGGLGLGRGCEGVLG